MLARQLEGSDATLNDDQRKRLLAALIEERKRVPDAEVPTAARREEYAKAVRDWQDDYNERVDAQARSILDTEQYDRVHRIPAVAEGNARAVGDAASAGMRGQRRRRQCDHPRRRRPSSARPSIVIAAPPTKNRARTQ